jgi:hypothetical protein
MLTVEDVQLTDAWQAAIDARKKKAEKKTAELQAAREDETATEEQRQARLKVEEKEKKAAAEAALAKAAAELLDKRHNAAAAVAAALSSSDGGFLLAGAYEYDAPQPDLSLKAVSDDDDGNEDALVNGDHTAGPASVLGVPERAAEAAPGTCPSDGSVTNLKRPVWAVPGTADPLHGPADPRYIHDLALLPMV